jgi:hypothetical protein
MPTYFYYQVEGGEERWNEALSAQRDNIIASKKPRYSTILDLDLLIDEDTTQEQMQGIRYFGDFYADFDSDDIEEVISKVQKFIKKLVEMDLDLSCVSFYLSGKKGMHITIPKECFVTKPNPKGVLGLPNIYKEIAFQLYVDTLDLKVYSSRRGRMFRTVNVERENGKYKVQVTAKELENLTEDEYAALCSAPRDLIAATTPKLNEKLAVMYAKAEQRVAEAYKRRGAAAKDNELLQKFKGEFPDTIKSIMNGEGLIEGAGFNKIAMQLGITANGLGKSAEDFIDACEGLLKNHVSDGTRYNSEKKREAELRRMFDYTQGNVLYAYSVGAIKSLLKPGTVAADLNGVTDADGEILSEVDPETNESMYVGVVLTTNGVLKKTEEGFVQICDLGFKDVKVLKNLQDDSLNAIEAVLDFRKNSSQRKVIGLDTFMSKSKFQAFSMTNSGAFTGSDAQVSPLFARVRDMALKNNGVVYLLHKEGLDVIKRNTPDGPVSDVVWVGSEEVKIAADSKTGQIPDVSYRFLTKLGLRGVYKTDLMSAPNLEGTEHEVMVLTALLNMNEPKVMGNLLGWVVSCFHRAIYGNLFNQFPIAQVFGQAGCGKSTTVKELLQMFYFLESPKIFSASKSTKAMLDSYSQSSASIPLALDEYKPREMKGERSGEVRTLFRESYNNGAFGKMMVNNGDTNTTRDTQNYSYSAPIVFMGEGLEAETAVLERAVCVMLSKQGLQGREKNMDTVQDNRAVLSSLGKSLVYSTFLIDLSSFRAGFDVVHNEVKAVFFNGQNHRVVYNIAVVINGLKFLKHLLNAKFQGKFDEKLDQLLAAVGDISNHVGTVVMSESSKVLNVLSYITSTEHQETEFGFKPRVDYILTKTFIDIRMRNAYVKYTGWCRRKGREILYDTEESFMQGLGSSAACIDRVTISSELNDSSLAKIYRFDLIKLEAEMVEAFR